MKSCRTTPCSRRAGSRGFSLVELMIAVTIGLLLVVVLAQLFLGSRQTFATTDYVSRMQDNIRFAQIVLTRTVHLAGYKSQANSVTTKVFQTQYALEAVDNAAPASDVLTIRYQGSGTGAAADGTIVDCLGVRVDAGAFAVNTFSIANGVNGRPALFCFNGAGVPMEIVPNVVNMQVLFGEDLNGDLVADRYVTPGSVTTPTVPAGNTDQFLNVVSVRIALLFETPTETPAAKAQAVTDSQTYDMLGNNVEKVGPLSDGRIRRLVVTTVNLRNRTP